MVSVPVQEEQRVNYWAELEQGSDVRRVRILVLVANESSHADDGYSPWTSDSSLR
jgi:hypothetical protein